MTQIRNVDILVEIIELTNEIINDVRQQLSYFRASVYKDETASYVDNKIERLRFVVSLFPDELMMEPFRDFDAEAENAIAHYVPGECSFSARVTRLIESIEEAMVKKRKSSARSCVNHSKRDADASLTRAVQAKKSKLMSVCRHGSRQWAFFQRI